MLEKGHQEVEIRGLKVDGLEENHRGEEELVLQHVHNQVNEPRRVPVRGDTNCQGVPFSLISSEEMSLLISTEQITEHLI